MSGYFRDATLDAMPRISICRENASVFGLFVLLAVWSGCDIISDQALHQVPTTPLWSATPVAGSTSAVPSPIIRQTPSAIFPVTPSPLSPIAPILISEWEIGPENHTANPHGYFRTIAWSEDNQLLAVGLISEEGLAIITAFDVAQRERLWSSGTGSSFSIAFDPTSAILAIGNIAPGVIELRDAQSGDLIEKIQADSCPIGPYLAFYPDENFILTGYYLDEGGYHPTSIVNSWNLQSRRCTSKVFQTNGTLLGMDLDRSRHIAVATIKDPYAAEHRHIELWNLQTIQQICSIPGLADAIGRDRGLIAIYNDKPYAISIFDIAECRLRNTFKIDMDPLSIDITGDGRFLAAGYDRLQFWDSESGAKLLEFDEPQYVMGVAFSRDGNYLATVSGASPGGKTRVSLWALDP
jgi:WD40 repeat protein